MPTAAKLFAAVMFAAVGFLAAQAYVPSLPEGTQIGFLREICAGLGLVIGWFVMGRLVGKGYVEAVGFGIRTSVTILFWATLGFSIYEMILRSTKMMYDGPMEALLGVFDLMIYYGTSDDNVHPKNALQLIKALQDARKSFEVQVGPDRGHTGIDQTRIRKYSRA